MYVLDPPMGLGETLSGKDSEGNLINGDKLGMKCDFYTIPTNAQRGNKTFPAAGHPIRAVLLRNTSGITLLGKRLGLLDANAGYAGLWNVDGYVVTLHKSPCVLIDPFLASTGVEDDAIFWGIIGGPVLVLTPMAGADFGSAISVGDMLVAATGSTSGATTSGRVAKIQLANATDAAGAAAGANAVWARALSAATTGQTNESLLVEVTNRWFG